MKKYIATILLILICYFGYGQTPFPIQQNLGSGSTLVKNPNYGGLQGGLIPYTFADTTAANTALTYLKNYCGAIIYCTDVAALFYRSCYAGVGGYRWVMISPSGVPSSSNSYLLYGNAGLFTSASGDVPFGFTVPNYGIDFTTNNTSRFILDRTGILAESGTTVGLGYDPSNSNKLTQFSGGGSTPTWQQTLTAGSTLTGDNTIAGGGNDFTWSNFGIFDIDNQIYLTTTLSQMFSPDDSRGYRTYNDSINIIGIGSSETSTRDLMVVEDTLTGKISHRTIPSSSTPTWQQTLTAGSTLTQANDIEADGYDFRINDAGELGLAGDSITLSANAGSNHLHIKGDSSSLNKRISYESDLSSTFTQYSLVDKNYVDGPYIYGEYLNTTFPGASLPTGFAKLDGAATITFNNPSISITGGDGNVSNNYVRNTDTSASNNYDYIWEFTLDTKFTDYTSQGKWFGKRSVNGAALWSQIAMFRYGGSSSLGRVVLFSINGTGNGSAVDSSGTISMADGNTYRIKYSQIQNVINVKLSRLSSGTEVESVYINYRTSLGAINVFPSIGVASFGSLDATSAITVTDFTINYNDIVNADLGVLGTSITQGYTASSMNNHYLQKAFNGTNKTFINYGQASNTFAYNIASIPRLMRNNPSAVMLEAGVNDAALSVSAFRASLQAIYDSIVTGYGKTLIILKDFSNPTYDTIYYNFCAQYGLTLIDPASVMVAGDYSDGTHPNDKGFDIYANFCKAALPSLFGSQVVNDRYSLKGLNDVTVSSPSNGQALTYNSTTTKWENSTLGTGYVNLQSGAITQQTGNLGITGYAEVNTGLAIGGANVVGTHLRMLGNTVNNVSVRGENTNSAGTYPYYLISQMGVTGYSVADWPSATVFTAQANGGMVLSAYAGSIKFQTGTSYVTRGNVGTNGLYMGGNTAATARLHLAASTTAASSGQIKFVEGSNLTTPEDGNLNYVSNNLNFTEGSTVYTLAKTLTNTATLDFGNTAAGVAADLTITVTGAAVGDAVYVGVDNASVSADNITFWGWVSATNTVTVRFNNNNLVSAVDPASGTFRVVVTKY